DTQCIRVLGKKAGGVGKIGDRIIVTVKEADPRGMVKKHQVVQAVIVRQKKELRRKDGSYIRFDDNACVLLNKDAKEPRGSRIFGPIPKELRERGYTKII
ncbi:unnamed protein product, partial [marine sediment metagenome]